MKAEGGLRPVGAIRGLRPGGKADKPEITNYKHHLILKLGK